MGWRDCIASDRTVLVGKPVIKGTRISVELVLGWLAHGWTYEQILASYPHIAREDILAALAFAGEMMRDEQCIAARKHGRLNPVLIVNDNFPAPAVRLFRRPLPKTQS